MPAPRLMTVLDMSDQAWRDDAACVGVDPEVFFPHPADEDGVAAAVVWCDSCPVRVECLEAALTEPPAQDYGIRGGLGEDERGEVRADRARRDREAAA